MSRGRPSASGNAAIQRRPRQAARHLHVLRCDDGLSDLGKIGGRAAGSRAEAGWRYARAERYIQRCAAAGDDNCCDGSGVERCADGIRVVYGAALRPWCNGDSRRLLACTVWKKRGRPICFGIAAAGAALAIARLTSMLGYLVDLWSTSREYADGGDWPIVWESAGIWLRHDWPYYLFYLVLIVGGLLLARRLKKRGEA